MKPYNYLFLSTRLLLRIRNTIYAQLRLNFTRFLSLCSKSLSLAAREKNITFVTSQLLHRGMMFWIFVDKKSDPAIFNLFYVDVSFPLCAPVVSLRWKKKYRTHRHTRCSCCCWYVYFALANLFYRIHNVRCNTLINCMWLVKRQSYQWRYKYKHKYTQPRQ